MTDIVSAPPVERLTHRHLLTVVFTEASALFAPGQTVRVLDAGCGNGHLIVDLHRGLQALDADRTYEIYGFDVHDWEYGPDELIAKTRVDLAGQIPDVPWDTRITSISTRAPWPYDDGFFDVIVSNQVLEHVDDHDLFFQQIKRTLRPGGFSAHLFPPKNTLVEVHTNVPFVHWANSRASRLRLLGLASRLGLGRFRKYHRETGATRATYCRENADFLERFTNFQTTGALIARAQQAGLRADLRYTSQFYTTHLQNALRRPPTARYARPSSAHRLSAIVLQCVSCVTLFLES